MTRTRATARKAGPAFERAIANYLATTLGDDRIDRRVRTGANDRGDIANLYAHRQRIVVECKDVTHLDLPGWINEAHKEATNDNALVGVVIHKRRNRTDPGQQWVTMTLDDWLACLYGKRWQQT